MNNGIFGDSRALGAIIPAGTRFAIADNWGKTTESTTIIPAGTRFAIATPASSNKDILSIFKDRLGSKTVGVDTPKTALPGATMAEPSSGGLAMPSTTTLLVIGGVVLLGGVLLLRKR